MDPITLALITSAIGAATKTGLAAAQNAKSKKLANQKRPEQQVPEAVQLATQSAQQAYNNPNMVGYDMAKTQLRSNAADANYALQQQGGNNNAVTAAIAGNTNNSLNDLYQQYVNRKDNLRGQMIGQLNSQGQYEQSNFEVNKLQPYLDAMKAAAAQKGAATQNLGGAITDVTSGLTAAGGMMNANAQNADLLKALTGDKASGTSVLPSEGIANVLNGAKPPIGTNSVLAPKMTQQEAISAALPSIIRAKGIDPKATEGGASAAPITPNELFQVQEMQKNQAPLLESKGMTATANAVNPLTLPQTPIAQTEPMINVESQIQNFAKSPKKAWQNIGKMSSQQLLQLAQTDEGRKLIQTILNSITK